MKITGKIIVIAAVFGILYLNTQFKWFNTRPMDVIDWLNDKQLFDRQISDLFIPFDDKSYSPIFPFRVNLKAKSKSLTFCNIPVLDAWLLKFDNCYTFYFIVRKDANIIKVLTTQFGTHSEEITIDINNIASPTSYHWDNEQKIIVRQYHNILDDRKYDSCILIMFGNMSFNEITGAQ